MQVPVYKDHCGKSQLHSQVCPNVAKRGLSSCSCPRRLAYGTVDSYIGKLRAIFSDAGRQGDWNRALHLGNPAADDLVKLYLKQVTAEQLQAHSTPKQALPIFPDKLLQLSRSLEKSILRPSLSPSEIFILARDQAFFKALFYSGDRAGDLGLVKTSEIARFPDDSGLLFNHVWGKTLRDGSQNLFGMRRHPNPTLCPVRGIELYVSIAGELSVDLSAGYLFRPTDPQVMFSTDHYRVPPQPHALSYISGRPTLTQEKLFTALDLAALLRLLLRDRALPMLCPMLAGPLRRLHATTYSSLISSRRVHQRISFRRMCRQTTQLLTFTGILIT